MSTSSSSSTLVHHDRRSSIVDIQASEIISSTDTIVTFRQRPKTSLLSGTKTTSLMIWTVPNPSSLSNSHISLTVSPPTSITKIDVAQTSLSISTQRDPAAIQTQPQPQLPASASTSINDTPLQSQSATPVLAIIVSSIFGTIGMLILVYLLLRCRSQRNCENRNAAMPSRGLEVRHAGDGLLGEGLRMSSVGDSVAGEMYQEMHKQEEARWQWRSRWQSALGCGARLAFLGRKRQQGRLGKAAA